ncbi:hypothetical protein Tco_1439685 [Tanacetum coccineum]
MDDAEKNDEDKVEKEKDIDQEPALDEQAKDDQVGFLASKTHKEKPTLFMSTSRHFVSSNYAPFLDVLASVVPPTLTTPTPPPIPTTTITKTKGPTSTSRMKNVMDQGFSNLIKHKKRPHDDDDRDQDPRAGPDQGLKKSKTSKDAEPSKKPKSTGSSKSNTSSQPKSTGKSVQADETVFKAADTDIKN